MAPVFLVTALAAPGVACPYSLDNLLQIPLERLMELTVTPRRAAQAGLPDTPMSARGHDSRRARDVG